MIKIKTFGVIRLGSGIKEFDAESSQVKTVDDCFNALNIKSAPDADKFSFDEAQVFVNHTRTTKRNFAIKDGDEVWLMSPASGG